MINFVSLVMETAAAELLLEEAAQIEEEMQRFLSEMEQGTVENARHGVLLERFIGLLKRRGEIARKALILFKKRKVRLAPGPAQHDARTIRKALGMNVATPCSAA